MMEVILAKKQTLSELCSGLTVYPQKLQNVRVRDKKAAQADAQVQQAVEQVAEALGERGRILVRESGTEPVIRVMVEAPTQKECEDYVNHVYRVLQDTGHVNA